MRNRARCEKCKTIIESKYRHDFCQCVCGSCFVDGGTSYERCGYDIPENFTRIHDDGTEENMVDSIRKYEETQVNRYTPLEVKRMLKETDETTIQETAEEKTNRLLQEVLSELKNVKKAIRRITPDANNE